MISGTLMKQTVKSNFTVWFLMTAIQSLCLVAMSGIGSSIAMTGQAFYSFLPGLITGVYVIIVGNKLLSAQVDKGSMAYILSTPIKRSKVAATQVVFFVVSLFLMYGILSGAHIVSSALANDGILMADVLTILKLNTGLFALSLAFGGICFCASGIFNLSKYTIAVGGSIVGACLILSFMGMFGGTLGELSKFSLVSFYDITSIIKGSTDFIWKLLVLVGIGGATFLTGSAIFAKKDLPL